MRQSLDKYNLTKIEFVALQGLKDRKDIAIGQTDKGISVIVLDTDSYKVAAFRQLADTNTYRRLNADPTMEIKLKLSHLLDEGKVLGAIEQKTLDFLLVTKLITPIFHHLPKVHKEQFSLQGHSIVAGIGERLNERVDEHLHPLIVRLPGYLRDTGHLLAHTREIKWSLGHTWITVDFKALYSCITHALALEAVKYHLTHYSSYSKELC